MAIGLDFPPEWGRERSPGVPRGPSKRRPRRDRALIAFLVVVGASLVWTWFTTEGAESVAGPLFIYLDAGTRLALFVAGGLRLLAGRPRVAVWLRRGWRALARGWVTQGLAGRAGLVVAVGLVLSSVADYAWAPIDGHQRRVGSASVPVPGVHPNESNRHVPPLVQALAGSDERRPVVVDIDDADPRGNQASYYAYPRLIVMEPELRRWSLRARQYALEGTDALDRHGFGAPPRPDAEGSQAYAQQRQLPLARVSVHEDEESGEPVVELEWTP